MGTEHDHRSRPQQNIFTIDRSVVDMIELDEGFQVILLLGLEVLPPRRDFSVCGLVGIVARRTVRCCFRTTSHLNRI